MAPRASNFRDGYHRPKTGPTSLPNCNYCVNAKKGCFTPLNEESCDMCTTRGKPCVRPQSVVAPLNSSVAPASVTGQEPDRNSSSSANLPALTQKLQINPVDSDLEPPNLQQSPKAFAAFSLQRPRAEVRNTSHKNLENEKHVEIRNMNSQISSPNAAPAWSNNAKFPSGSAGSPSDSQSQPAAPALPAELRLEPRQPVVWSSIRVGGKRVDFNNETAYLNSVDENGALKPLFSIDDIPDGSGRYQPNPVYPFEPVLITRTSIEAWLKGQAIKNAIVAPTFDEVHGEWSFHPFAGTTKGGPANAVVLPCLNGCKDAIICCGEAKCKDSIKIWSLYHATLMEFAKTLVGKAPWKVIQYSADNEPDFSRYRYYFNTVSHVDGEEATVRRFACNSLSARDVVELKYPDPMLPMCMENEIGEMGSGEYFVRLRGIEFECDKDLHKPYRLLGLYWVRHHAEEYSDEEFGVVDD